MRTMASRRGRRPHPPLLRASCLLLGACLLLVGGCGHRHHHHHVDEGRIVVDNRTDLTTDELLLAFRVAPFGRPFTGDLLGGDLAPGDSRSLGFWPEDYYDGEGDLELGQLIEWFDLFVGDGHTTVFEVR